MSTGTFKKDQTVFYVDIFIQVSIISILTNVFK